MYYYTYNTHILAAAGIVGILVIAVVLTALLAVLVLPKHKDGQLPAFSSCCLTPSRRRRCCWKRSCKC